MNRDDFKILKDDFIFFDNSNVLSTFIHVFVFFNVEISGVTIK